MLYITNINDNNPDVIIRTFRLNFQRLIRGFYGFYNMYYIQEIKYILYKN